MPRTPIAKAAASSTFRMRLRAQRLAAPAPPPTTQVTTPIDPDEALAGVRKAVARAARRRHWNRYGE